MPMHSRESGSIAATLAQSLPAGASAAQIADAMLLIWREIDAALRPIIGPAGVAALYKRSVYLSLPAYPWLAGAHEGGHSSMDLSALQDVVSQQGHANAAACCDALLHTFHELLTSLVGSSLTERLLRSVWATSFNRPSQDSAP